MTALWTKDANLAREVLSARGSGVFRREILLLLGLSVSEFHECQHEANKH